MLQANDPMNRTRRKPARREALPSSGRPGRRQWWPAAAAVLFLAYLVGMTFYPVLEFEFIDFDVTEQVLDNPYIRALTPENLKHILTSPCISSYYPVRTLSYALDFQLWGLDAGSFKRTNVLIHLGNVLLVLALVLRLRSYPGIAATVDCGRESIAPLEHAWKWLIAAFAAGWFAIHPLVVEPVVWVPGREELLMTLGALGTFHFHLGARRASQAGAPRRRVVLLDTAAAACCAAACLSNAVGAVIPLLVLAWDLLALPRSGWGRGFRAVLPLVVIAAITVAVKLFSEADAGGRGAPLLSVERLLLVFNAYALNLKAVVWPSGLGYAYAPLAPRGWSDPTVLLGAIAVVATLAALLAVRRRRGVFFGLLWFGLALGPTAQVLPHHIHRADRFLYLPLAGLAMAVGAGLYALRSPLRSGWGLEQARLAGACRGHCRTLPRGPSDARRAQVWVWQNDFSLLEHSLVVDPDNHEARCNLADRLVVGGERDRAGTLYEEALRRAPTTRGAWPTTPGFSPLLPIRAAPTATAPSGSPSAPAN